MATKGEKKFSYKSAGVDIAAGNTLVELIKPLCQTTLRPEVLTGPGGFAGLFRLADHPYQNPVLVAATDGVGTKLKLAGTLKRHDTIGIDLVAMCANDVLAQGGEPLLFLDYFACGKLSVTHTKSVIKGIAEGCIRAGCSLIGGETAEMPGVFNVSEYDIAGFCVGLADEKNLCGAHRVKIGDAVIGLASSGVHSNGYSLIRKILAEHNIDLAQPFNGENLGETLLKPTSIYVKPLLPLIAQQTIHALAHITGGGIGGNLTRILNDGQAAKLNRSFWPEPAIFDWLRQTGKLDEEEMLRVFNCGIGMIAVVASNNAADVLTQLNNNGCQAWMIGEICPRTEPACVIYA